jgi:hypothetical protein
MKPTAMTEKKWKRANQRRGREGAHESTPGSQETDKGERESQGQICSNRWRKRLELDQAPAPPAGGPPRRNACGDGAVVFNTAGPGNRRLNNDSPAAPNQEASLIWLGKAVGGCCGGGGRPLGRAGFYGSCARGGGTRRRTPISTAPRPPPTPHHSHRVFCRRWIFFFQLSVTNC